MTTPHKGKVCPQIETMPPIRLDELPLSPAEREEARAKLAKGDTLHVVDPVTRQARRVVAG